MQPLFKTFITSLICYTLVFSAAAQVSGIYTVKNAHSHNDYVNPVPFYKAFNRGFGSIEADIYPVNGQLLVAHSKKELKAENTLQKLYLEPILMELRKNPKLELNLLIDIKENSAIAMELLLKQLQPFKKNLSTPKQKRNLTILISGDRPLPLAYKQYPDYIFFDFDLSAPLNPQQLKRVGLVSLYFKKYSKWKGEGKIPTEDRNRLQHVIDSVHTAGKPIRFWAAPDNKIAWTELMKLRVDYIGTDKIDELANFILNKSKDSSGH
ncbi:MAG: phosphatidylinositol-specific phospholipase C/glycerophosphodiester phosphodiesterase family protein [Sphingobacteriaceae bacterium]